MYIGPIHEFTLSGSRALPFVLREYADMLDAGFAELEISFYNTSHVCHLEHEGRVVAATVWGYDAPKRMGWTFFSAVAQAHRGKGLYGQLTCAVEDEMRRVGALTSCSSMAVNNHVAIAAAAKQGKLGYATRVRKFLK